MPKKQPLPVRFYEKVDKSSHPECWLWIGWRDQDGYGMFWLNGRDVRATRVAWELENGPSPPGSIIMHSCDNPPCVNPGHLRPGTHTENMLDMRAKSRGIGGANHHRSAAILTEEQVLEIRRLNDEGARNIDLTKMFNVSHSTISFIVHRKNWRHI